MTVKYDLEGKEYTQLARLPVAASDTSISWATSLVDDFQPGVRRMLPYNPSHPDHIYVPVGWSKILMGISLLLGGGLVFVLVSWMVWRST